MSGANPYAGGIGPRHPNLNPYSHQPTSSLPTNTFSYTTGILQGGNHTRHRPTGSRSSQSSNPPPTTARLTPNSSLASLARTTSPGTASSYSTGSDPYHPGSSGFNASTTTLGSSSRYSGEDAPLIQIRPDQKVVHTYNATVSGFVIQFLITVEQSPTVEEESMLTLTYKSGGIERPLCGKEHMRLAIDPQTLRFHIFVFPKPSLPADCLYCVRVWLEAQGVQHRIFSDENLWVGKDPPFSSIQHVALTRQDQPSIPFSLRPDPGVIRKAFKGYVGRASCDFIVIMKNLDPLGSVWGVSVEYQAGGISRLVFEQTKFRLHCRVDDIKFIIYTVPIDSSIPYSNHRIRVWVKGMDGICQRLFKSDEFRVGAELAFEPLLHGPGSVVFATKDASAPTITNYTTSLHTESPQEASSPSGSSEQPSQSRRPNGTTLSDRERSEVEYQEQRMGINVGIGNARVFSSVPSIAPFDENLPSYQAALSSESGDRKSVV